MTGDGLLVGHDREGLQGRLREACLTRGQDESLDRRLGVGVGEEAPAPRHVPQHEARPTILERLRQALAQPIRRLSVQLEGLGDDG